jgi:hypothetical protein
MATRYLTSGIMRYRHNFYVLNCCQLLVAQDGIFYLAVD